MTDAANKTCEGCQSTITAEQIVGRQAGLVGGVLLCPTCVEHKRQELIDARNAAMQQQTDHAAQPAAAGVGGEEIGETKGGIYLPPVHDGEKDVADESLSMVSDEEVRVSGSTQIRSFSEGSTLAGVHHEENYKRPIAGRDEPATRCRTFHGKLTQAGLAHMDEQINEWLDAHPEIFIKSTNSAVGTFEGKTKEPHLLMTLFY